MANDYDNTNKGAAFKPFDTQSLILQGKLNDDGKDMKVVLVRDKTREGKTIIEVFEKVGVLFENDKKGNDAAPDYTGPINEFRRLAAWRKSKEGQAYMTMSVSEAKAQQQEQKRQEFDDEIPPF
jgi:hypothetical protein